MTTNIVVEEHDQGVTVSAPYRLSTTWTECVAPKSRALNCATHSMTCDCRDKQLQVMEGALQAILIEASRVCRGNFVSLVDDLEKIRNLAYRGLRGE